MATDPDPATLDRVRDEVAAVLTSFLAEQRELLAAISADMLPWLDAMDGLLAGGKRLRPAFCYWGWRAAGGSGDRGIFTAAASLELLHASALVHDDVMDASDTRRGRPAVHRQFAARHRQAGYSGPAEQFGAASAILIGDMLLSWTGQLYRASALPERALLAGQPVLDAMRAEVVAGQYLDLVNQHSGSASAAAAMLVVTYKTAKYTIERPLHLGAALAGAPPDLGQDRAGRAGSASSSASDPGTESVPAACTGYGIPLGIAFQLRDDILGVFGDPARTGKPVTGDISAGKRTVLMALARDRASAGQARILDHYLGRPGLTPDQAAQVRAVIADTGALDECEALIAANAGAAVRALDGAPIAAAARAALTSLAARATERDA